MLPLFSVAHGQTHIVECALVSSAFLHRWICLAIPFTFGSAKSALQTQFACCVMEERSSIFTKRLYHKSVLHIMVVVAHRNYPPVT